MNELPRPGVRSDDDSRDWILPVSILAVVLLIFLIPFLRWRIHEARRPVLVEVRVVSATSTDPVFREGYRTVTADEEVSLAVALKLDFPGREPRWLSPVERLELDGSEVDHLQAETWPEDDRTARTFWFTLECPYLGGVLEPGEASSKLKVRPFLAPELGQRFRADGEPEQHSDDGLDLGESIVPVRAGTYRIYARVEVTEDRGSSRPLFAVVSHGADHRDDPRMLRISRDLGPETPGLDPAAGRLFRLPGFDDSDAWDPDAACKRLFAVSPDTFLSVALTGRCRDETLRFKPVGTIDTDGMIIDSKLRWGTDVFAGDVIEHGDHRMILVSDDGDGRLDGPDLVAHTRRRPAAVLPLIDAVVEGGRLEIVRRVGPPDSRSGPRAE